MEATTKKEPKVKVKGNGMNGKIIVQARKFYKEIPVVLFSSEEANTLLKIVDKMEIEQHTFFAIKANLEFIQNRWYNKVYSCVKSRYCA